MASKLHRLIPGLVLLCVVACGARVALSPERVGFAAFPSSNQERLSMVAGPAADAGDASTITVGAGQYVHDCTAAGTGTAMTMTVTPCNSFVVDAAVCTAQPAVPIPSGIPLVFLPPMDTTTNIGTVADTSTIVFAGPVSQYWCNLYQYNP